MGFEVRKNTSTATVFHEEVLYFFYVGAGNDCISYATSSDGETWSSAIDIRAAGASNMSVAPDTSPAVVVFQGVLYVFFQGSGNDGTWYTYLAGSYWSQVFSVSALLPGGQAFCPKTSPSTAAYQRTLILSWIWPKTKLVYNAMFNGEAWTYQIDFRYVITNTTTLVTVETQEEEVVEVEQTEVEQVEVEQVYVYGDDQQECHYDEQEQIRALEEENGGSNEEEQWTYVAD